MQLSDEQLIALNWYINNHHRIEGMEIRVNTTFEVDPLHPLAKDLVLNSCEKLVPLTNHQMKSCITARQAMREILQHPPETITE